MSSSLTAWVKDVSDGACSKSRNAWEKNPSNDILSLGSLCKRDNSKSSHSTDTLQLLGS